MATKIKNPSNDLSSWEWAALSVIGREGAKHRDELGECKNEKVDVMLRVTGYVNVAPDGKPANKKETPKPEQVLAFIIQKLRQADGQTITEETIKGLLDAVKDESKANGNQLPAVPDVYNALAASTLLHATRVVPGDKPKRGALTGSFQIGVVDTSKLATNVKAEVSTRIEEVTRAFFIGESDGE